VSLAITAEVWKHAPIGKGDLLVLLRIADAAGEEHRMMWESVKTLAKHTRMTERSIYNSLRNLALQDIIETVPKEAAPPEARLYKSVVRRVRPVEEWIDLKTPEEREAAERRQAVRDRFEAKAGEFRRKILARDGAVCRHCGETDESVLVCDHMISVYDGGTNDLENLQILCVMCNSRKGRHSEVGMQNLQGPKPDIASLQNLHPEQVSYNPNNQLEVRDIEETTFLPPRRSARSDSGGAEEIPSRPGARGWDAVAAPRRGGRKKTRKQQAEEAALAEKELDPAYVVAQALGEEDPGSSPAGRLPASDSDLAPPVRRPREKRSKRPSEELAEFFGKRAEEVGHPVPGATNLRALTGQFGRWMAQGLERETIRQMVLTYWSSSWSRSENHPAWKDFLAARGLLTERLGKAENVMEKHRHDESYWD
jgi:5-methylcytosine-specific restriction endonuclease McrA